MSADSSIAWTDHTFNPWWGCVRVSPGCEHCYAEAWDARFNGGHWGKDGPRRFFGDAHWNEPRKWNREAERDGRRARVFCASMADVFEDRLDLIPHRERLWRLILETPQLDWQLLTKRPENLARMVPWKAIAGAEPWPNVWIGTTVEDQRRAEERVPVLNNIPAVVRFLSVEPLLERVDLRCWLGALPFARGPAGPGMQWVIVGGESGSGARPCDLAWLDDVVDQCKLAEVPVFVKQWGSRAIINGNAIRLRHAKGGDPEEWPEEWRVREYPEVRK